MDPRPCKEKWGMEDLTYHELYGHFKEPYVEGYIKLRWLQWAGHVVRMDDRRMPERVLVRKMEAKNPNAVHEKDGKMLLPEMQVICWECENGNHFS